MKKSKKQSERNTAKADFNRKSVSRVFLSLCFKQERGIAVGVTCGVGVFFERANVFTRESAMTAVQPDINKQLSHAQNTPALHARLIVIASAFDGYLPLLWLPCISIGKHR